MLRKGFLSAICLFISVQVQANFANSNLFVQAKALYLEGKKQEAIQDLKEKLKKHSSNPSLHFAIGRLNYEMRQDKEAQFHLSEAIRLGSELPKHAHLLLAESYYRTGKNVAARSELYKLMRLKPDPYQKIRAKFISGMLDLDAKKYRRARSNLRYAEKRMRGEEDYPYVLWSLMEWGQKTRNHHRKCRWARKLYSKFPYHHLTESWGVQLQEVLVNDKKIFCSARARDIKNRFRNLILTGEDPKAEAEHNWILSDKYKADAFVKDMISARYFIQLGEINKAIAKLLPHYDKKLNNQKYLEVFAKAAAKAGEFKSAIGAYYRIYKRNPRSRKGRFALFQAAFISYQFQDYDGASQKFEEFLKKYRSSGLRRDSKWYLAWLKYLKKDYKGALKAFQDLSRYRRWRYQNRVQYWKALSLYNAGDTKTAKKLLRQMSESKYPDYYSLAATAKLFDLQNQKDNRVVASLELNNQTPMAFNQLFDASLLPENEEESEDRLEELSKTIDEEEDLAEDAKDDQEFAKEVQQVDEEILSTIEAPKDFSRKTDQNRFDKASELIAMGFLDMARWELYYIEKKTKKEKERIRLIEEYKKIQAYHRSSYVSQTYFHNQRTKEQMNGESFFWKEMYPKAFSPMLEKQASRFALSPYFVWGLMRAESLYKESARSPVGAMGLLQIMPFTGRRLATLLEYPSFDINQLYRAEKNIELGSRYLKRLSSRFDNKLPLMAAGYNAGPHRVKAWLQQFGHHDMDVFIEHIPFLETRNYVKKVLKNTYHYQKIYAPEQAQAKQWAWLSKPVGLKWEGPTPSKEDWSDLTQQ